MTLLACSVGYGQDVPREPGVWVRSYQLDRSIDQVLPLVPGQTPNVSQIHPVVDLNRNRGDFGSLTEHFITHVDGFVTIDTGGTYEFQLTSDDGSELWVAGTKVVDNDGLHGAVAVDGAIELAAGVHAFAIHYFQGPSDAVLRLAWRVPESTEFKTIPAEVLSHRAGVVRVTAPGPKKVLTPLSRDYPGAGQPLNAVHPSYDLMTVRPEGFEPRVGGIDFLSDGRMVVCTWDPVGGVYLLDGVLGDSRDSITVKRIAAGLAEPLGIQVVDDEIYVLQKQELTQLIDLDGDDVIDEYRCISSGWPVTGNFHEFAFGLAYQDGFFYANLAVAIDPGGASTKPQAPERGTCIRIGLDGEYEIVASGLRTPNTIGEGVDGELFITDNQGDWVPVSKIVHVKDGAFYGSRVALRPGENPTEVQPPVVWLPQNEIGNSPGEPAPLDDGPYAGQMIHGDVTHGGLKRVFVEKINGEYQGCVFRFTQGLEAGVNRVRIGPDGSIFIGGIGSTGNWQHVGKKWYGLQRLTYNDKTTFEMLAIRAKRNGLEVEFTEPLPEGKGWTPGHYLIEQFRYEPTEAYGGPKLDKHRLVVKSASVNDDRTRVFLELDDLKPGYVQHLRLMGDWRSASGQPIWTTEGWYTMNHIPSSTGIIDLNPPKPPANQLTEDEVAAGWELLFDGRTIDKWRGFKRDAMPDGWSVIDGQIVRTGPGGDFITVEKFDDFEFSIEWKVEPGGNSGIFFNVAEDADHVWQTGPEMQILDNDLHVDGRSALTSAGANYALHAPPRDVTYPPGAWNEARIRVVGDHVQQWLNGVLQADYVLGSDDWKKRVAASKFARMPRYGRETEGHIALQDHGDRVAFRNIKIRRLDGVED